MDRQSVYETYAYVLDFPVQSTLDADKVRYRGFVAHVIGEQFLTLLEVLIDEKTQVKALDRIIVGKEGRSEVKLVLGRISYSNLTGSAKSELSTAVDLIIRRREKDFVAVFNGAQAISSRMHALELIPGLGKKYCGIILNARDKTPFQSFDDLQKRTGIPDPVKLLTKRVIEELSAPQNHFLLVRNR